MSTATGPLPEAAAENEITVLVVDDAAIDRRMTGAIIERSLGWRVTYAEDGAQRSQRWSRSRPAWSSRTCACRAWMVCNSSRPSAGNTHPFRSC